MVGLPPWVLSVFVEFHAVVIWISIRAGSRLDRVNSSAKANESNSWRDLLFLSRFSVSAEKNLWTLRYLTSTSTHHFLHSLYEKFLCVSFLFSLFWVLSHQLCIVLNASLVRLTQPTTHFISLFSLHTLNRCCDHETPVPCGSMFWTFHKKWRDEKRFMNETD